jgi:hypothetical protein
MYIVTPSSLERFPSSFHCPVDIFFSSVREREEALVIEWILGIESLSIR